jgi:hypothetical protein
MMSSPSMNRLANSMTIAASALAPSICKTTPFRITKLLQSGDLSAPFRITTLLPSDVLSAPFRITKLLQSGVLLALFRIKKLLQSDVLSAPFRITKLLQSGVLLARVSERGVNREGPVEFELINWSIGSRHWSMHLKVGST